MLEQEQDSELSLTGDVGDFTFVFVGDMSDAALESLVSTYLASLPGSSRRDVTAAPQAPRGVRRVRVARGSRDKSSVSVIFDGDEASPPGTLEGWTRCAAI
jgi:hypothetical protein